MDQSIVKNAKRNIFFGIINKTIVMLCPFFTRTVVRFALGVEFLGLDSLFISVISVLGLAELGLSSAIVYHLYKPVVDGDNDTVNSILAFYKKAYRLIGTVILLIGIIIIPLLPRLINGGYPNQIVLWKVYMLFLINTVVSYFMYAYLSPLITVYQREDINSNINSLIALLLTASKLLVLVLTKNYYIYLAIVPVFTIISNLCVAHYVHTNYPQYKCNGKVSSDLLKDLKRLVMGTFIQKACGLTRNSVDSIFTSIYLGLTITAVYNNYFYISTAVTSFVGVVTSSFAGGIGNHVVKKTIEENYEELKKLDFAYMWIAGWCTVCLMCLYQPFMRLWMGNELLLDYPSVVLMCVYFYLLKLGDTRSLYAVANGLWWKMKWKALMETMLNISLNIVLGRILGLKGIILATMVSWVLCNWIWSTRILFAEYFGMERLNLFYRSQITHAIITIIVAVITLGISMLISQDDVIADIVYKILLCLFLPNVIYLICFFRTQVFKEVKTMIIIHRLKVSAK